MLRFKETNVEVHVFGVEHNQSQPHIGELPWARGGGIGTCTDRNRIVHAAHWVSDQMRLVGTVGFEMGRELGKAI